MLADLSTFSDGGDGSGWTTGIKASVGVAINLSVVSPTDGEHTVFVESYIFAEIDTTWADGFGDQTKFDMSDTQLQFGVSFDFD